MDNSIYFVAGIFFLTILYAFNNELGLSIAIISLIVLLTNKVSEIKELVS